MKVRANGIDIEVEDSGADGSQADRPVVLLIMGLGMQLVAWPPALVHTLLDAGYRVVRHDNRDIGLSQHFDHLGVPNLLWTSLQHRLGFAPRSGYSVHDMALDALGVLDALRIPRAHVVGVSMGGMIAQRVAIAAPARVTSLTSIMSSSGARGLPGARPDVLRALISRPQGAGLDALLDYSMRLFSLIGSPAFPVEPEQLRERVLAGLKRSYHPAGTARQMVAVAADTTRARELAQVRSPTLVLHGKADPLVPFVCGEDTARRIPGARMVAIDGWGHDLPPGVLPMLCQSLLGHMGAAR